jgi:hypothetical protein
MGCIRIALLDYLQRRHILQDSVYEEMTDPKSKEVVDTL